jgi:PAS domain S-box-containing protein
MPDLTPRILLVDDREDKLLAVEAILEPLGIPIQKARSGSEAIAAARADEFAVILLDVRMPRMDGFETAAHIRKEVRNESTPIIFVSAVEDEELIRKGYALGAVDYVRELIPEILCAKVAVFVDLYEKASDLSERRRIERQLQAQYTVARLLSEAAAPQDVLRQLLQTIAETFGWQWSAWWARKREFQCVATWQDSAIDAGELEIASRGMRVVEGVGVPGRVIQTKQPVWITDLASEWQSHRQQKAAEHGWKSAVGFPVLFENEVLGVIECFSRTERPEEPRMLDALRAIGSHIGQAIARNRTEARKRGIFEASLDSIITIDHNDRIVEWNPAAERTFGFTREEALGQCMANLIVPERLRVAHREGMQRLLRGEGGDLLGQRIEMPALRADGAEFPAELAIIQIASEGPPLFTGYVRDISNRKRANEQLERAKQAAEAANRSKDQFIAALSHELRTPLTPVVALLPTLLESTDISEEARADLLMIKRNVELEARLIDDLLDLTQISKGTLALDLRGVDAKSLVEQSWQIVRHDAEKKRVTVSRVFNATEHEVWADPVRLQQVLWNLLQNAIKYTPEGGDVRVETSNPTGGTLRFTIRDSGIGVAAGDLSRIFQPFERPAAADGNRFGGLGLGLFITKAIVEQHGGRIDVSSPGKGLGTTFTVELATNGAGQHGPKRAPLGEVIGIRPLRILLVEDHANTREVLTRLLTRRGHFVKSAESVTSAFKLAEANKFDLIISDLGLPDGSGLDLMPALKSRYGLKGIAVSGFGMEEDVDKSRSAGFSAHLIKPVDFRQLEAVVSRIAQEPAEE